MTIQARRSVLYMPGANPRAMQKARELPADAVILDLEDSITPDAKAEARNNVVAELQRGGFAGREVVVRVNALDSEWGEADLMALRHCQFDALLLPKVADTEVIDRTLALFGEQSDLAIWTMAETPRGVLNIDSVAAHPRVRVIVMGTNDLAKELRIPQTPQRLGFLSSLGLCVLAARANGCDIIDGVYINLDDAEGLRAACHQGVELGFDGKTCIHPKQLAITNEVFSPSVEAIEQARTIVSGWQQAQQQGKGVLVVNGRLVEELHVQEAERVLALAQAMGLSAPENTP